MHHNKTNGAVRIEDCRVTDKNALEERGRIRMVLESRKGSKSELARRAGVSAAAVGWWLRGGPSKKITAAAREFVAELEGVVA